MYSPVGGAAARIRAVFFDLGGTLVDNRDFAGWTEAARRLYLDFEPDDLRHAYQEVLPEMDAETPIPDPERRLREEWRRILARAAGKDVPSATVEKFAAATRARPGPIQLYSDTRRCLDQLRHDRRALGVISNSTSEARVRQILDQVGILDYFGRIVSSGTEGVEKPDPTIFRRALDKMEVAASDAMYVGDLARTDAKAAQSVGMWGVWLNREGFGYGEDPPEITSLLEVPLCVQRIERGLSIV
jgi:HAD superfamily hydrolase (TIGR01509 family)